jgi:hypothetical protein
LLPDIGEQPGNNLISQLLESTMDSNLDIAKLRGILPQLITPRNLFFVQLGCDVGDLLWQRGQGADLRVESHVHVVTFLEAGMRSNSSLKYDSIG